MKADDNKTTILSRIRAVALIAWTVVYVKGVFVPICTSALAEDVALFVLFIAFAFAFYIAMVRAIYGHRCC